MKVLKIALFVISVTLFFACGSSENKKKELPVVDVTKSYPKKEIVLQDIADVEYVSLETRDDVLLGRFCRFVPAGKDKILSYDLSNGDIFLFTEKGKFLSKFNHKGQSGEEYVYISKVVVDDVKNELFVFGYDRSNTNRIQVYDFEGTYKRTLTYGKDLNIYRCVNFNATQLLCYHNPRSNVFNEDKEEKEDAPKALLLSKETGNIDTVFKLSMTKGVNDTFIFTRNGKKGFICGRPPLIVNSDNGFILNEIACDTIFEIGKDQKLQPLLLRTPPATSEDNPLKMLGVDAVSSEAYYLEIILKQFNPKTRKGFDKITYLLQKSDNQIFEYSLKNADIMDKEEKVDLNSFSHFFVEDLKELLEEGKLSGKLKEIAERLADEDNPVLMRVRLKK